MTSDVTYERLTITSGSYAGDSPMPGLVHRGIKIPTLRNLDETYAFPGLPVVDRDVKKCYKYTYKSSQKWYFTQQDTFLELPVDDDYGFVMSNNPEARPELYVVGHVGQTADTILNIMGEIR